MVKTLIEANADTETAEKVRRSTFSAVYNLHYINVDNVSQLICY